MKVELDDIVIGLSAMDSKAQIGVTMKNKFEWKHKKEVDNNFIECVIKRWEGYQEEFTDSKGDTFIISVKKVSPEKK